VFLLQNENNTNQKQGKYYNHKEVIKFILNILLNIRQFYILFFSTLHIKKRLPAAPGIKKVPAFKMKAGTFCSLNYLHPHPESVDPITEPP
jgi:hypothetical protein